MILVCTSNSGKLREFEALLHGAGPVKGLGDYPQDFVSTHFGKPVENQDHFVGNAWIKLQAGLRLAAATVEERKPGVVLVDDSGLCVPQLDFAPGVHSATFAGEPRSDQGNRKKLADCVRQSGQERLEAYFVSVLLCADFSKEQMSAFSAEKGAGKVVTALDAALKNAGWLGADREKETFRHLLKEDPHVKGRQQLSWSHVWELPEATLRLVFGLCFGFVSSTEQNLIPGEGHGYDALFFPVAEPKLSFASVPLQQKNLWSHRAAALECLRSLSLGQKADRRWAPQQR